MVSTNVDNLNCELASQFSADAAKVKFSFYVKEIFRYIP
jgi:hypothetical protein